MRRASTPDMRFRLPSPAPNESTWVHSSNWLEQRLCMATVRGSNPRGSTGPRGPPPSPRTGCKLPGSPRTRSAGTTTPPRGAIEDRRGVGKPGVPAGLIPLEIAGSNPATATNWSPPVAGGVNRSPASLRRIPTHCRRRHVWARRPHLARVTQSGQSASLVMRKFRGFESRPGLCFRCRRPRASPSRSTTKQHRSVAQLG